MTNQARRYLIGTTVVLIGWYLCVIFLWAVKPLSDAVPTGIVKETNTAVSQAVSCHSLFTSSARGSEPLPTVVKPLAYQRSACTLVHSDARVVFAIDTLVLVLALAALVVIALRLSKDANASVAPA